jgi:uncharacterized protein YciI
MSYYAVIREAGPGWTDGGITGQDGVSDHAEFMNGLADDGLVRLAGPVAGTETGRLRVILIMNAESEDEIRRRLADDPWVHTDRLAIKTIEPWNVMVGAELLATVAS